MSVKDLLIPIEQDKRDPLSVGVGSDETVMVKQGPAKVFIESENLQDVLDAMIVAAGAVKQIKRSAVRIERRM